jgi:hypothetical protein
MTYKVDAVIGALKQKKKGIKCSGKNGLINMLELLGFDIEAKGSAGHKVYFHPLIDDFQFSSFDCGHSRGKRAQGMFIKPVYINDVIKKLNKHKIELIALEIEDAI